MWIVYWSTLVGGPAELGVRWLNTLPGVVDVALIYGIGKTLLSRRAGAISAALMAVAAPCIRTSRFVYTDGATFALLLANLLLFLPVLVQASDPVPWWRWRSWIALWLLEPVLVSPADSRRTLLLGTIPLLGVSGDFINFRVRN